MEWDSEYMVIDCTENSFIWSYITDTEISKMNIINR